MHALRAPKSRAVLKTRAAQESRAARKSHVARQSRAAQDSRAAQESRAARESHVPRESHVARETLARALFVAALALIALSACERQPAPSSQPSSSSHPVAPAFDVVEVSLTDLQNALKDGRVTSRTLVDAYLARIEKHDPALKSIISLNPRAREEADQLDRERKEGTLRGPLHGIPIVIKDNIDFASAGLANTAGSLALVKNIPARDAPVVRRLLEAGAIVLAKNNLSEWANIRSQHSSSGWSAVGGLARNPYDPARSACGSSSGSGTAVAASFAAASVGTETDGSVTCPAAINGLVGIKPTVGLVSRTGIIPISHVQDTAGPMTRTVADLALMLSAMAGSDPDDAATKEADARRADYSQALKADALKGTRLGVLRFHTGYSPPTDKVFESALEALRKQGAELVDIPTFDFGDLEKIELECLLIELKADLNKYLASTPQAVQTRTLAEVIAFNRSESRELEHFGQNLFERAEGTKGLSDPAYVKARRRVFQMAGPNGIDRLLREHKVVALIAPTTGPAWTIDLVNGDHYGGSSTTLPAVAGYPHLTVPMGEVRGLPLGLSFIGPAWSEALLISLGYAYEQATHARKPPVLK
jgi:amidase